MNNKESHIVEIEAQRTETKQTLESEVLRESNGTFKEWLKYKIIFLVSFFVLFTTSFKAYKPYDSIDHNSILKKEIKANKNLKHVIMLIFLGLFFFILGCLYSYFFVTNAPSSIYNSEDFTGAFVSAQRNLSIIQYDFDSIIGNSTVDKDTTLIRLTNDFRYSVKNFGGKYHLFLMNRSPKYDLEFRKFFRISMNEDFPEVINTMEKLVIHLESLDRNDKKIQNLSIDIIELINKGMTQRNTICEMAPETSFSDTRLYNLLRFLDTVFYKSIELNEICKSKMK